MSLHNFFLNIYKPNVPMEARVLALFSFWQSFAWKQEKGIGGLATFEFFRNLQFELNANEDTKTVFA